MKVEVSKEWCEAAAKREGDAEIGAGAMARDPLPVFRCDNCDNGVEVEWKFCAWCGAGADWVHAPSGE